MKKNIVFVLFFLFLGASVIAQKPVAAQTGSSDGVQFVKNWEKELFDVGMSVQNDSLHFSEESQRLLRDSVYRSNSYPKKYNWPEAIQLMNKMELKKAFWHMINLYRTDTARKELVLQVFVKYDSLIDMEKVLINSFYTYALTDPEICVFQSGKPVIRHPEVLEGKLNDTKEIIGIIRYNREQTAKAKG